jgi:mannosyltransferase
MTIIIDSIIFSLQKAGGISSYWFNLSIRLLKSKYFVRFIEEKFIDNIEHAKLLNINRSFLTNYFVFKPFNRYLNVNTNTITERFIFHSSYYRVTKNKNAVNVVTVHDFIYEKYYKGFRKWLHLYQKAHAIKNADVIITVSSNTKKDLLEYYPEIQEKNIKVVYNGVSDDYFPLELSNSNFRNSILFVGSRETYKNFKDLVEILHELDNFNLIVVGNSLNKNEITFLDKMLKNRWQSFTHLNNNELNNLYNSVFALSYVSLYEGFGIPLLEAMKAGCPFIALNNSSIPEVAGDAGVLIDSLNSTNFISAINKILDFREDIIEKGYSRVKLFSWDKNYEETLKIYLEYLYK